MNSKQSVQAHGRLALTGLALAICRFTAKSNGERPELTQAKAYLARN